MEKEGSCPTIPEEVQRTIFSAELSLLRHDGMYSMKIVQTKYSKPDNIKSNV